MQFDDAIDTLYTGCKIKIISCESRWSWYHDRIGQVFTVTQIRKDYDDVIICGVGVTGNCVDFEDLVMVVEM